MNSQRQDYMEYRSDHRHYDQMELTIIKIIMEAYTRAHTHTLQQLPL